MSSQLFEIVSCWNLAYKLPTWNHIKKKKRQYCFDPFGQTWYVACGWINTLIFRL